MGTVELRHERKGLIEKHREILAKAENEKRELNTEEQSQYDAIDSQIDKLDSRIEREEKLEGREKSLEGYASPKRTTVSDPAPTEGRDKESRDKERREVFLKFITEGREALTDAERRALSQGTPSKGGFLSAPETLVSEIIKLADNQVYLRQKARKFTCERGGTLGVPTLDARASVFTRGGETGTLVENDTISFGRRELKPIEFMSLFKVTEKLLASSTINIEQLLKEEIAYALAISEEQEFMTGSGAGQALGLFTASSDGISTGRDVSTDNTSSAVTTDNLIEVQESIKDFYQPKCEWIGSRTLRKKVRKLKNAVDGSYLWEESIQQGGPGLLLGKPFTASEYCPATFTTGLYVGIYGDFSNFWIADSLSLQIKELNELYAENFKKGYRCLTEMDAMPIKEEAFARIKLG